MEERLKLIYFSVQPGLISSVKNIGNQYRCGHHLQRGRQTNFQKISQPQGLCVKKRKIKSCHFWGNLLGRCPGSFWQDNAFRGSLIRVFWIMWTGCELQPFLPHFPQFIFSAKSGKSGKIGKTEVRELQLVPTFFLQQLEEEHQKEEEHLRGKVGGKCMTK